MEKPAEAAPRAYDQVVFIDIPRCFPPAVPVTCRYSLAAGFQPSTRDWVGIFKVGWSTIKDYHTFVWAEPCQDEAGQQSLDWQALFKEYYLPKDEVEFYQFCYVDSGGQVRGASTPFCFKNPEEQSMEGALDDDLLVITTQEQVDQNVREKAELMKELAQLRGENETLKRDLQREQQEVVILKGKDKEKCRELTELTKEHDRLKEQNEVLGRSLQEMQHKNEEVMVQMTNQMALQTQLSRSTSEDGLVRITEEKYERAVAKINQLKEERQVLREKVELLEDDIAKMNSKVREAEREAIKMKDTIQFLELDLQSSAHEKEEKRRLLSELCSLKDTMEAMKRRDESSPRQEMPQSHPDDELQAQCQSLAARLEDVQAQLAAERNQARNVQRRVEAMEAELLQTKQQMEELFRSREEVQRKSSKLELQLTEAHELIADRDGIIKDNEQMMALVQQEKEQLEKEKERLNRDIEGLRRTCEELNEAADLAHRQTDNLNPANTTSAAGHDWTQQGAGQSPDMYQNLDSCADPMEQQSLVCRHCLESFPGITQEELELHEQTHRVCPFCTIICDNMEQAMFEDHVYSHEM